MEAWIAAAMIFARFDALAAGHKHLACFLFPPNPSWPHG
jgi:hypothetical protein